MRVRIIQMLLSKKAAEITDYGEENIVVQHNRNGMEGEGWRFIATLRLISLAKLQREV